MESELASLQRRVAELEAALTLVAKRTDGADLRRRGALAPLMCAGVVMLCVGILLGGGAGSLATSQSGPSKVVAPFSVVDGTGPELFRVASASGTGAVLVYDDKGNAQVVLGSPSGSGKPQIQVLSTDGSLKTGIGVSKSGDGLIIVKGAKGTTLYVNGNGGLAGHNAQDKPFWTLTSSGFGGGDLHLYNSSGVAVVGIFSESGQTGIAQFFNAAGQERVTLGTLTNGKGDVCASGNQGANCLSRLNPQVPTPCELMARTPAG